MLEWKLVKLVIAVASWFKGVITAPFAPYVARQKAKADDIANKAAIQTLTKAVEEVTKIAQTRPEMTGWDIAIKDGKTALTTHGQYHKRQENAESVFRKAANRIDRENIKAQAPDQDWTARFFDYVRDVSQEDLQEIWARILSGELEKPGRVPLRTLSVLRDMSQDDAHAYIEMMQYRIGNHIIGDCVEDPQHRKLIVKLYEADLVHSPRVLGPTITIDADGTHKFGDYGRRSVLITGTPGKVLEMRDLSVLTLTPAGRGLTVLCDHQEVNQVYLKCIGRLLHKRQLGIIVDPPLPEP